MSTLDISAVQDAVTQQREAILTFLRELVAIPLIDSQIGPVGERAQAIGTSMAPRNDSASRRICWRAGQRGESGINYLEQKQLDPKHNSRHQI